jgi:hypothetical protein
MAMLSVPLDLTAAGTSAAIDAFADAVGVLAALVPLPLPPPLDVLDLLLEHPARTSAAPAAAATVTVRERDNI